MRSSTDNLAAIIAAIRRTVKRLSAADAARRSGRIVIARPPDHDHDEASGKEPLIGACP
jgi:hypothetical protein